GNYSTNKLAVGPEGMDVTASVWWLNASSESVHLDFPAGTNTQSESFTLPLGVVRGKVLLADGTTPVNYPNVVMINKATSDSFGTQANDELGNYLILTSETGDFTLTAQDYNSGLTQEVAGTLASLATPVVQNIQLPNSGTVKITVVDSHGNPESDSLVVTISTDSGFQQTAYAEDGEENTLEFDHVPA